MILGSHNSWTYLKPKSKWMKLLAFTARCQRVNITTQYQKYGVRCFDLRVRFDEDGNLVVAHGIIEYDITQEYLFEQLRIIDKMGDCYIRVLHEVRSQQPVTLNGIISFQNFCDYISGVYTNIKFFGGATSGRGDVHYDFSNHLSCEGKHASVCPPKLLDDWLPIIYSRLHNKKSYREGSNKDVLFMDFVDIGK